MTFRDFIAALALLPTALMVVPFLASADTRCDAEALLRPIEQHYLSRRTLAYTAERVTKKGATELKELWRFQFENPDRFRIDYRRPTERLLVCDGHILWEYVPAARKAVKTDLNRMPPAKREQLLASLLQRVALDGVRVGPVEDLARRAQSVTLLNPTGRVARLEGEAPRYVLEIDCDRNLLLRSEHYDENGVLRLRTQATAFTKAAPGQWHPTALVVEHKADDDFIVSRVSLRDVALDSPFPPDTFNFTPPRHVRVEQR